MIIRLVTVHYCRKITINYSFTRPLLLSTHIACFLRSTHKEPATVGVIVAGGACRKPGPSLSAVEGFEGAGRILEEISSPGKTNIGVAIFNIEGG